MKWVVLAIGITVGGWLVFDGARALIAGQYVTPKNGAHAGQLGPWKNVLERLGLDPRGVAAKWLHILCGGILLVGCVGYVAGTAWAARVVVVGAVATLWYLPFGTLLGIVLLLLVFLARRG